MSLANRKTKLLVAMLSLLLVIPMTNAFAMHIMEGYLPPNYCIIWGVVCIPFLIAGGISMQKQAKKNNKTKILLALAGAFVFILSSLKNPFSYRKLFTSDRYRTRCNSFRSVDYVFTRYNRAFVPGTSSCTRRTYNTWCKHIFNGDCRTVRFIWYIQALPKA